MNKQEIRALKAAKMAREAAAMKGPSAEVVHNAPRPSEVVAPPPSASAKGADAVVVSDSEETRVSLPPLKRKRREKFVTSGATSGEAAKALEMPFGGPSGSAGAEGGQIKSPGALIGTLFSISHSIRLSIDYVKSLEFLHKECELRGERIREMKARNTETQKLLQRSKEALTHKDKEVEASRKAMASMKENVSKLEVEKEAIAREKEKMAKKLADAQATSEALKKKNEELEMTAMERETKVEKKNARIQSLDDAVLKTYKKGYAEALSHLKFFHPDEELGKYDAYGEIKDGAFVKPSPGQTSG